MWWCTALIPPLPSQAGNLNSEAGLFYKAVPGGPGLLNKAVSQNKTKTTKTNIFSSLYFHAQHRRALCCRVQCPIQGPKSVTKRRRLRGLGPREHSKSGGVPSPAFRSPSPPCTLRLLTPPLPRPRPDADVSCYVLTGATAAAGPVLRGRRPRPAEAAGTVTAVGAAHPHGASRRARLRS